MTMTANRWGGLALGILIVGVLASGLVPPQTLAADALTSVGVTDTLAVPAINRNYWSVPLDSLAVNRPKHTHAIVKGTVAYCVLETDGDRHVRVVSLTGSGRFVIAEWMPEIPLRECPKVGTIITVWGVTRWDPEHRWAELHPAIGWELATP